MPGQRFDRFDEKMVRLRFVDEALHSGFERLPDQLVGLMHGKHDDFRVGQLSLYLNGGLETVHLGHCHVEDHDVGLELDGLRHRFAAVGSDAANFPAGPALDHGAGPLAQDLVVVGD